MSCGICLENVNEDVLFMCPGCKQSACVDCCKKGFEVQNMILCPMLCGYVFNRYELYSHFGNFVHKKYNDYKREYLYNQLVGKLPWFKGILATEDINLAIQNVVYNTNTFRDQLLKRFEDTVTNDYLEFINDNDYRGCRRIGTLPSKDIVQKTNEVNFGICTKDGCNSKVSPKGVCPVCHTRICIKCKETVFEGTPHECNEEDLKWIEYVNKSTKRCPSCQIPCQRPSGCYQVFCGNCKKMFDWNRLVILHERGHNPDYLDWMNKNGHVRNDGECQTRCISEHTRVSTKGGVYTVDLKDLARESLIPGSRSIKPIISWYRAIYEMVGHINYEMRNLRIVNQKSESFQLLKKFYKNLDNKTAQKKLKSAVLRSDKAIEKKRDQINLLEVLVGQMNYITTDMFESIHNKEFVYKNFMRIYTQHARTIADLFKFINKRFQKLGYIYKNKTYRIYCSCNDVEHDYNDWRYKRYGAKQDSIRLLTVRYTKELYEDVSFKDKEDACVKSVYYTCL